MRLRWSSLLLAAVFLTTACLDSKSDDDEEEDEQQEDGGSGVLTQDAFAEQYTEQLCDHFMTCEEAVVEYYMDMGMDWTSAQANYTNLVELICDGESESGEDDECDFDPEAASSCLEDLIDLPCEFWTTGSGFPDSCQRVCG